MKRKSPNPLDRPIYSEFGTQPASAMARPSRPDLPWEQQKLKVEASRKGRKGKTVTLISGFQVSDEQLTKIAKQLKNHCGTGGTVKENIIEVQGEHGDKVQQFFSDLGCTVKRSGR
jgi:translation initiation factor 1